MIQTTLSFVLGFLCAAFLALLVAPAIWRRAVALTRRRVEASLPMTMEQIKADKDSLRAEFAMSARKLELRVKSLANKSAGQAAEMERLTQELKDVSEKSSRKSETITGLETRAAEVDDALRAKEDELQLLADALAAQEKLVAERLLEIENLGRMYDEASFNASSRQIEIVAQETKAEKLSAEIAALRAERKDAATRAREANAEAKTLRESLRGEQRKVASLEKKADGLIASSSGLEEKLERRERELARMREQIKEAASKANEARNEGADELSRLKERLTVLTRENRKLREGPASAGGEGEALLREQIATLAAQVVNLTAKLDGRDATLREALLEAEPSGDDRPQSLAERILALQDASAR